MTAPLPPQTPLRRRHIPLRARDDYAPLPRFDAPRDPVVVQRYEPNEPRSSIELRELLDPYVVVAALGLLLGGGAVCVFWFTT